MGSKTSLFSEARFPKLVFRSLFSEARSPKPVFQSPFSKARFPKLVFRSPFSEAHFPKPIFRSPFSEAHFPKPIFPSSFSEAHFPKPIFRSPFSEARFPKPVFQSPFSEALFPKPVFRSLFSEARFPKPVFRSPFSKACFPKPVFRNPPDRDIGSSSLHEAGFWLHQSQSTLYATKTTAPTPNPTHEITISIEILHNYIELEKTIRTLENRNISSQHTSAKEELDAVCKHIDQVNSSPPTPGTEDYDTALENHQKILLSLHGQKMHLEGQINSLVTKLQTLQSSMDRRDDMLEGLFGGCYGSSLEDQLEEEFIKAANKLGHVRAFYQHWKAAIVYTQKAFEQISTGYHFWQKSFPKNFTGPDGSNLELMIANGQVVPEQIANVTNARSWFIASSTNLGTAVRICIETLKVNIPYCQPNEIETLNKAIHHIFIDAKTADRHLHAGKVYYSMGTRAGGLYKWLETVLSNNISVDLKNAENYHVNCREALTNERHRLKVWGWNLERSIKNL